MVGIDGATGAVGPPPPPPGQAVVGLGEGFTDLGAREGRTDGSPDGATEAAPRRPPPPPPPPPAV